MPRSVNRVDNQEQAIQEFQRSDLELLNDLRNVITAFRLTRAGDVAVTGYPEQSDEVPPFGGNVSMRTLGVLWSDFQVRLFGNAYSLDESDIGEVQSFVKALGLLDGRKHRAGLEVGLRRFNQSYSREYYEDRLIDLTIALESTLLADAGGTTDLRYRLALHGAALLSPHRDPEEVRKYLLKMYDVRSAVVHTGKSLSEYKKKELLDLEWRDFAQACEDMTRSVLVAYVRKLSEHSSTTVQSITKGLESRIVHGLGSVHQEQLSSQSPPEFGTSGVVRHVEHPGERHRVVVQVKHLFAGRAAAKHAVVGAILCAVAQ